MKAARISKPRRAVYDLIVDGLGPGAGLSPPRVQEALAVKGIKMSRQRVYDHVKALEKDGYIRRIRGTKSPALYERGENAAFLDNLAKGICQPLVNPSNGGGPIVHYCGKGDKTPLNTPPTEPESEVLTTYVVDGEAHVDGRYVFPVMEIGELYEPFRVRDPDTGEISMVTVWEPEPTQLENGVEYYQGFVPILGGIKIQFWQGAKATNVHIWPTPVKLVPGRVRDAPEDLAARAQDVANWLGRFGGWRLGIPEFVPNKGTGIHYACNDPAVVGNFPLEFKGAIDAHNWVDSTPPPRAYETDEAERMEAVIGFAGITRDLKRGQQAIRQDLTSSIRAKELQIQELRESVLDRQIEIWQSVDDLSAATLAALRDRTAGGMYQ